MTNSTTSDLPPSRRTGHGYFPTAARPGRHDPYAARPVSGPPPYGARNHHQHSAAPLTTWAVLDESGSTTPPTPPTSTETTTAAALVVATTPPSRPAAAKPSVIAERFKTKPCRNFMRTGACPYEHRCMFAHGTQELRTVAMNMAEGLDSEEAILEYRRALFREARRRCMAYAPHGLEDAAYNDPAWGLPDSTPVTVNPPDDTPTTTAMAGDYQGAPLPIPSAPTSGNGSCSPVSSQPPTRTYPWCHRPYDARPLPSSAEEA